MDKICGTCGRWKPPVKRKASKYEYISQEPRCPLLNKVRYSDNKPQSWCWTEASEEQLKSRVKAGLIEGEIENGQAKN